MGSKHIQWTKDSLFNKWFWENWTDTCRNMKLDPFLTLYAKQIKELNVRLKTIKILEENIGSKLLDISRNNIFSNISPWARETKGK